MLRCVLGLTASEFYEHVLLAIITKTITRMRQELNWTVGNWGHFTFHPTCITGRGPTFSRDTLKWWLGCPITSKTHSIQVQLPFSVSVSQDPYDFVHALTILKLHKTSPWDPHLFAWLQDLVPFQCHGSLASGRQQVWGSQMDPLIGLETGGRKGLGEKIPKIENKQLPGG